MNKVWKGLNILLMLALLLVALVPAGQASTPVEAGQPLVQPAPEPLGLEQPLAVQQGGGLDPRLPYNRIFHSTILDEDNDRLILFGGFNGRAYFNDVWALSLLPSGSEAWTKLEPEGFMPAPRGQHTAIYDSVNHRMIVFGGHSSYYNWDDVWALSLTPGSETWTQIAPTGSGPGVRRWHTAVYDQANNQMVVFGGSGRGGLKNDVWKLSLTPGSETWSPLAVIGSTPAARAQHTAVYSDTAEGLMVVFGGATAGGTLLNDTWALNLTTGVWNQIAQTGDRPSARRGHTAIFNFVGGPPVRMEVFGGQDSSGFLNDGWALEFAPGDIHWEQFTYYGTKPSARAWHSAVFSEMNPYQTTVLGGRGTDQSNGAQWALNMSGYTWSPITPTLPSWAGQMGAVQTAATSASSQPQVTLEVEDALPNTMVNLLSNSEVWFVAKIKSTSSAYANNITVTLNLPSAKFDTVKVGTRHKDWEDVPSWSDPSVPSSGQYRKTGVNLTKLSGESDYSAQVVFKAHVKGDAAEGVISNLYVKAKGANWTTRLEDYASARIYRDPQAWIITNRALLLDKYNNTEAQQLLDEAFEQAQGSGYNSNPTTVVLYADRYVSLLKTWDNRNVNYTSDTTANVVADAVADWLVDWIVGGTPYPTFAYPEYLVILGDDNVIPFYRKHEYVPDGQHDQSEDDHPDCWGDELVCDEMASHNYHMTDNPYGDQEYGTVHQNWEDGDLEAAVGRIVGATAADMQFFLENSVRGPSSSTNRAVVASDGLDWWLTGDGNDAHDVLKDSLGYSMNESLIDQKATKTQIINEMQQGFAVAALAHHGETYVWDDPADADSFPTNYLVSYDLPSYDTSNRMSANRPFFYFNACRIGISYTDGWSAGQAGAYDDTMIYALVHRGASGIIASAGLGYGAFDPNMVSAGEVLGNNFWVEAKAYPDRSDPLGWALMRAKIKHPVNGNITEKKTVQTFTYFGVPWMRLPGHEDTAMSAASVASAEAVPQANVADWSAPVLAPSGEPSGYAPAALQATYMVTAHVSASGYTTSTTMGGFHLIEIPNFTQRVQDGLPVLPRATMDLILPLSATISSVVVTPTLPVVLTGLNIPTEMVGVPIPGGATGGYTTTVAGTYPATVTRSILNMGTYRIARFYVIPVGYNAATDGAVLYQAVDLQVIYDTPRAVALTYFTVNKLRYLPGDPITATASISNVGSLAETVTPTLRIMDLQGQFTVTVGAPVAIPAGGTYDLSLNWTGYLDGDVYMAHLFLEQGGEVVAGAGRQIFITEGAIADLAAPDTLMPGQTGVFTVTFQNFSTYTTTAIASLTIYDSDDAVLAFLEPKAATVVGAISATLTFTWTADRLGPFTASTVILAGGEEYGPVSQNIGGGKRIFLPVVLKNQG